MKKLIRAIKKKSFHVGVTAIGAAFISLTAISNAYAVVVPSGSKEKQASDPFAGLTAAIRQLGNEVKALATASAKTANTMMYQVDNYLFSASQANSHANSIAAQARDNGANLTQTQVTGNLLQFPEEVVNPNQLDDPKLAARINNKKQLIPNLTAKTPASDTLYISNKADALASIYGVAKPKTTYDNYFNFDSLITPAAYDTKQQKAAHAYVQYAAQQYKSLANGINFTKLKSELNNLSPAKRAQKLQSFINNPIYQKYQLTIRSLLASKSVALSNLNYLMAERIAIKGLATKTGVPHNPQLPKGYASPLEVENYIANERLNNPAWVKAMQTASPAAVNREQLMILAEIESELQRNHLDHERLLATLSIIALQSSQLSQMTLINQAQKVNHVIDPTQHQSAAQQSTMQP